MNINDLLQLLLIAADDEGRVFDHVEIATWPPGALDTLQRLQLVHAATSGLYAPCPNCDERHIEPVTAQDGPNQTKRYFIHCPESMRVEVEPQMCTGWQVDCQGLAKALVDAMALSTRPSMLVPGRLWRLGRTPWKKTTREVLLATRLHESDAASITAHIGPGGRAIVLVPCHPPDERIWPGHAPAVVALSRIATLSPQGIHLDVMAVHEIVDDADTKAETKSAFPVDPEMKKQVLRRQLKAEIKGHLEDDVLVAAYLEFGSYRKAAFGLTERLGRSITKDAVEDAVKRAGGIKALVETSDVNSVARTVASRSCDRAKKFIERRSY